MEKLEEQKREGLMFLGADDDAALNEGGVVSFLCDAVYETNPVSSGWTPFLCPGGYKRKTAEGWEGLAVGSCYWSLPLQTHVPYVHMKPVEGFVKDGVFFEKTLVGWESKTPAGDRNFSNLMGQVRKPTPEGTWE
jgi:hypothetical protein